MSMSNEGSATPATRSNTGRSAAQVGDDITYSQNTLETNVTITGDE